MAFIYNLSDTWNDVTTTWNGIKLAVTDSGSSSTSKLLNLTISGSSTGYFYVDKSGNLTLSGSVNKITMTAPATGATLTLADGSTLATSGAYSTTFTTTGTTALTLPTTGTVTALGNTSTGSGSIVLATSPTLVTPALGTPSSVTLTNATGLPVSGISATGTPSVTTYLRGDGAWASLSGGGSVSSVAQTFTGGLISVSGSPITTSGTLALTVAGTSGGVPYFSSSSTWASTGALTSGALLIGGGAGAGPSATTTGTGVVTALGVNVGSAGAFVVNGGALGTPSSGTLTSCTGLPISTGVSGLGTGVATALAVNVGSAGAPVVNGGALGTPSSGTLTNATGLPIGSGVSGLGTGVATFLATPSSANLASAVTDETGSGSLVFSTAPTFGTNITVGTASSSTGIVNLKGTTSGTVSLSVADAAGTWTMKLPTSAGTNGYYLQTDGAGNTTWAAGGGGGGGSPGGSNTQIQYNNSGAFGGSAAFTFNGTTTVTIGTASTTTGVLSFGNASSANLTSFQAGNASAAVTYTLPTAAPASNGYALTSTTAGVLSWSAVATGTINSGTSGQLTYYTGSQTLSGNANATISSGALTLGQAGTAAGALVLSGSTSGTVTVGVPATAGTTTFTLPSSNGTNNYVLTTNGSGVTSWSQVSLTAGVTGVLPVANGGTNASSAGITAFNNITGYTATGATGTTSTNLVFSTSPTITTPTISGNETHTGTAARFIADFDNATVNSRFAFQTTTTNAATGIYALPNGTGTAASWQATNAADPTNASKILIATNGSTDVQLVSGINGTGTYLPLSIYTSGGQSAQFSATKGTFTLGVAGTAQGILNVTGATSGTISVQGAAAAGTWTFTLPTSGGTANYALTTNGSGTSSWSQISLTAGVTGTLPVANGGTGITSGTSGAVLYYSATGTIASSAVLANNAIVVGGGAGAAPSTTTTGTGVLTALGISIGSAGAMLTTNTSNTVTVGYKVTPYNISSWTSFTIDPANGNYQYGTNNGAITITAPASDCAVDILIQNTTGAGTITLSGFTVVAANTGQTPPTTTTGKWVLSVRRINGVSSYVVNVITA